jgi:hypothetical protein
MDRNRIDDIKKFIQDVKTKNEKGLTPLMKGNFTLRIFKRKNLI